MQQYNSTTSEIHFSFKYPDANDPILSKLKELAAITFDSNASELEKIKVIIGYAHSLFTHNGDNSPSSSDPLTILKEAKSGKEFRCVEYSLLASALLWSYGIPSRVIGLKTSDVETRKYGAGHVVIEFWSKDHKKWIMCDVQAGIIPTFNNELLSAFELGEKVNQGLLVDYIPVNGSRFPSNKSFADMPAYIDWVREYLYFYDTPTAITFLDIDRKKQLIAMLVPLGVEPPKMFQGMFTMNAVYTHSVLDFYVKPVG
jgi:hypothetical protein